MVISFLICASLHIVIEDNNYTIIGCKCHSKWTEGWAWQKARHATIISHKRGQSRVLQLLTPPRCKTCRVPLQCQGWPKAPGQGCLWHSRLTIISCRFFLGTLGCQKYDVMVDACWRNSGKPLRQGVLLKWGTRGPEQRVTVRLTVRGR